MTWSPKPETVKAYTEGDCHLLAREVWRLTGFPMVFSLWAGRLGDEDWDHVAVRLPSGKILDVLGEHDEDVFRLEWYSDELVETDSPEYIRILLGPLVDDHDLNGDGEYRTQAQARACARRLLNAHRISFRGRRQRAALPVSVQI